MDLKIKKLTETAILPTRGSAGAAALDLYADSISAEYTHYTTSIDPEDGRERITVFPNKPIKVHTGISMAIPEGYVGLLFSRSGTSIKQGLRLANCVGVIDEDYRGEIIAAIHPDEGHGEHGLGVSFKIGDRIAQIVFVKYDMFDIVQTDDLGGTDRGTGGFGSTGT